MSASSSSSSSDAAAAGPTRLKLVSWNVASLPSLESHIKHEKGCMAHFLAELGCDVFCVQETKLNPEQAKPEQKAHLLPDGWLSYWAVGSKPGYCGIVTYCKPALEPLAVFTDKELFADEPDDKGELGTLGAEGRLVVTEHYAGGTKLVIFNAYVPNAGGTGRPRLPFKLRFLDALYRQMEDYRSRGWLVLLCGDLNVCADIEKDVHPELRPQDWLKEWGGGERAWFARALGRDGRGGPYIDTYRRHHPDEEGAFTFWAQVTDDRARNWGYRIDYVLVSRTGWGAGGAEGQGEGEEGVVAADILRAAMRTTRASDHAPVMAELALPPPTSVAAAAAAAGASGTGGEEEKKGGADGGGKGVGARAHAVGCVKHKVKGDVILAKLLPDPKQKSIRGFFVKKTAAAAASSASAPVSAAAAAAASEGNGNEEPAPKKARMEAAAAVPACKGKGLGKGAGEGGRGGALTKFFGKK